RGSLDYEALRRALDQIVKRHEVLATSIEHFDGRAVQTVRAIEDFELPLVEFDNQQMQDAQWRTWMRNEVETAFDLSQPPLFRSRLLRLDQQDHVLLMTMPHIVTDGWSLGVLREELGLLYEAYSQGKEAKLAALPIQYGDYAVWQREWLQGEVLEAELSYWREQLAGAAVLELPMDHPRPAIPRHRGSSGAGELGPGPVAGLKSLGRRTGVTLFMSLLAGFGVLLQRYAGQEDIVVGTPIAGRTREETEKLIGFFVNTLALRLELSGNPRVSELLGRVKQTA